MSIERQDERGSAVYDAGAGVAAAVDSSLVTLGTAEEPLEVEVVTRKSRVVASDEEALLEREHHLGHLDTGRVVVPPELRGERAEILFSLLRCAVGGVESGVDFSQDFHMAFDFVECIACERDAAVYAPREGAQRQFADPPFSPAAVAARSMESRISRRSFAMRTPGGASGPPWSLFSTPRTEAQ